MPLFSNNSPPESMVITKKDNSARIVLAAVALDYGDLL